jgi:hypothetical protein
MGAWGHNGTLASKAVTVHKVYARAITTLKELIAASLCHIQSRSSSCELEERCEKSEKKHYAFICVNRGLLVLEDWLG